MDAKRTVTRKIKAGGIEIGGDKGFALIAGPCVIESAGSVMRIAKKIKAITAELEIPFVFKASYDKANRSSVKSYRGPGLEKGLDVLKRVKDSLGIPVTSDVHNLGEIRKARKVLDVLQIPAFLCRQTDLILAVAETGLCVNVKKGQFLSPDEIENVIKKIETKQNDKIIITERGTCFGYNNLVSDFRSIILMREFGYPVCYDATHSVQRPGGLGTKSGGDAKFIPALSRAAISCGADALFLEVHENPARSRSDGPNMVRLSSLRKMLLQLKAIEAVLI